MYETFADRTEAGQLLARELEPYRQRPDVIVLALPRGGVPVASEIAHALEIPLDVLPVRKLGTPGNEELAMGAIAAGGVRVLNEDVLREFEVSYDTLEQSVLEQQRELERRTRAYRGDRCRPSLAGKIVILVDDGLATGMTMHAAVLSARKQRAKKVIVAVPVAPAEVCERFQRVADEVVCLSQPQPFIAVGCHYRQFAQVSDDEVRTTLEQTDEQRRTYESP